MSQEAQFRSEDRATDNCQKGKELDRAIRFRESLGIDHLWYDA